MAKITLSNLAHSYSKTPAYPDDFALKTIDHVWEDGSAYALLGPSGCGKSTLLNIISGLLAPSQGQVLFDDKDVTNASTSERNIAQVFQFPVVYDTMTVRQNLAFPLKNRKLGAAYINDRVTAVANMIGMQDFLNDKASGLTADAKQKISLGRGIVREDVNAILFDEPLTVIDPQMKWELRTQLKALHQQLGHTMIYVTHDQTEALTFADKVVVMSEGEVVQVGTPTELFERPAHTFVGFFIGSPGMNILPATVVGNKAMIGNHQIQLNSTYEKLSGTIEMGIRPEYIKLSNEPSGLAIKIHRVEDVGHHKIVRAIHSIAGQAIEINVIVKEGIEISDDMQYLVFEREKINIYANKWRQDGTASI